MKTLKNTFKILTAFTLLLIVSCSDDDNTLVLNQQTSKTYDLSSSSVNNVSGTAKFIKNSNGSVTLELDLNNTPIAGIHPAHIHFNTAVETGDIAIDLGDVDGATGQNSTTFTTLDDGTPITYEEMIDFDGYINVHLSSTDLGTIVSQGDIGQNDLTGDSISYDLDEVNTSGVSGTAQFFKRVNGEALAVLDLTGTSIGTDHLAHIHMNDVITTGGIALTYNNVDGETGMSYTNVSQLDDMTSFLYEDVLTYNGYVNIHSSTTDLTIAAQGNIGSNDGVISTPETISYDVSNSGTSSYNFTGNGLTAAANPNLTFIRGNTYIFNLNTPSHPFFINSTQGTGTTNAYTSGVTGNGNVSGTLTFVVPMDAPDTLFYNCQFHGVMTGTINVTD
ncbi:CHRD domain-containing protein [Aurantibacter sp.]|uniref:CHRD domain-containing protein n=1 Tax=Aurantibacter sp. TaxID=2807103 RepID=UPI0035C81AB9